MEPFQPSPTQGLPPAAPDPGLTGTSMAHGLQIQLQGVLADLALFSEHPDHVPSALNILNWSYATPQAAAARDRLRQDPAIAPLVAERYWGHWPELGELAALPEGSLGQRFASMLIREGLGLIPRPEGIGTLADDDQYLQLRARACHDLWHLVVGFPNTLPGEAAINGFGARQLRQPGPALLIAADLLSRAHLADSQPDVAEAIAFGLRLGGICAPLLAQRWEEGWAVSIEEWRHRLGIAEELRQSPFREL